MALRIGLVRVIDHGDKIDYDYEDEDDDEKKEHENEL